MEALAETVEQVFRSSSAALVASLTRSLGPGRLDLVEQVVQEAFVRALEAWAGGVPDNPAGWVHTVARNLALDALRRERALRQREDALAWFAETAAPAPPEAKLPSELADEQLTMIFVACHPCNTVPSQIVLALRTLCGFEVAAIARALYASEDAIDKRLTLARRRIREADLSFELPSAAELSERLDAVLRVLYLCFNEAYFGTSGPDIVQEDVAAEAIRLASFLAEHPQTRRPRVLALLALMHLHAARFPARADAAGELVTLQEQDRSLWDHAQIDEGLRWLAASADGKDASAYHYQAAIAAVHAQSPSHAATDWSRIIDFYQQLLALEPSPGAQLSRAIALGFRDGPARALRELAALDDERYRVLSAFHAALAEAHARAGDRAAAARAFASALACCDNPHERRYLERRSRAGG